MCFNPPKIEAQKVAAAPLLPDAPPAPPVIAQSGTDKATKNGRNSLRIDLAGPAAGNTSLGPAGLTI